jgi:hypothetical protein
LPEDKELVGMLDAFSGSMTNDAVSNQRRRPDTEICRTTYVAQSDLLQCLVEDPDACEFAIRFDSGVICRHPDRRDFENPRNPI